MAYHVEGDAEVQIHQSPETVRVMVQLDVHEHPIIIKHSGTITRYGYGVFACACYYDNSLGLLLTDERVKFFCQTHSILSQELTFYRFT